MFFETGTLALRAAAGDFNNDGILDLAISGQSGYSILLGHGDGSFGASADGYVDNVQSTFLFTGDFNGDGKIDLLLPAYVNGVWETLLIPGNGDGTFGSPIVALSGVAFNGTAIGDFNKDGALDIAGSNAQNGTVAVYLNDGRGTFASSDPIAAGAQADALTIADLNHDGKLDIVTAAYNTPDIWVLLGNGDGTFQAAKHSSSGTGSVEQDSIVSGDVNGDGVLDLVVTAYLFPSHVSQIVVLEGQGDGTFSLSGSFPTASSFGVIALADINRDGHLDLVGGGPSLAVLVNKGDGTFGPEIDFPVTNQLSTLLTPLLVIADLNGDGKPDVAMAVANFRGVSVALNTSTPGAYPDPIFTAASVVNAASYSGAISPGSLGTLFGVNLSSVSGVLSGTGATWPTNLAGTSLTVGGYPAPIAAIANVNGQEQINFQVPWELGAAGGAEIVVTNNGKTSQPIEVGLLDVPGLFSQDGVHPIALRVIDYSLVTDANPALRGEAIALYATGLGAVSPAWPTDTPASATVLSDTVTQVNLTLNSSEGGQGMTILFSGLAPGFIGLYQINAIVPTGVPAGELTLTLSNGWQGNTLKLPIR